MTGPCRLSALPLPWSSRVRGDWIGPSVIKSCAVINHTHLRPYLDVMVLIPWMVLTNTLGNTLSDQRADATRTRAIVINCCARAPPLHRDAALSLHPLHPLLQHSLMVLMPCVMVLN